jgi:hypothetical protein
MTWRLGLSKQTGGLLISDRLNDIVPPAAYSDGVLHCPYCLEEVKRDALVCRTCARDIAIPKPLMESNARLTARIAELEEQLAAAEASLVRVAPRPVAQAPAASSANIARGFFLYVVLPVLLLMAIHYLLVVRLDARLIWLRVVSIALPAAFGFYFELAWRPRWFVLVPVAAVVAIAAVLGMSWIVHLTDGDAILPASAVVWRETLEYVASIGLAYALGSLLCAALWPLHGQRNGLLDRLATMIALGGDGVKTGKALEARIERMVKLMNLAISVATASGAIYTGLKATLA